MVAMALPFDLEDVLGVALADVLRRVGMLMAAVFVGTLLGGAAVLAGELVAWRVENGTWDLDVWDWTLSELMLLPLRPVTSTWGMLYVPMLIGMGFYFTRAASPGPQSLAMCITLVGFCAVVGRGEPGWFSPSWFGLALGASVSDPGKLYAIMIGVGLFLWLGMSGSFWFFSLFWERRQRAKAAQHLVAIAHENEAKRRRIQEETGGAVADREFALGQDPGDFRDE